MAETDSEYPQFRPVQLLLKRSPVCQTDSLSIKMPLLY